eukprot:GHVS01001213.1.p1 GENE.GHVS01001213.1~~GHVS01001213.1.p1  ORF type:complete len:129 (+),score=11.96 GHVS01001213.1:81-467(+)
MERISTSFQQQPVVVFVVQSVKQQQPAPRNNNNAHNICTCINNVHVHKLHNMYYYNYMYRKTYDDVLMYALLPHTRISSSNHTYMYISTTASWWCRHNDTTTCTKKTCTYTYIMYNDDDNLYIISPSN